MQPSDAPSAVVHDRLGRGIDDLRISVIDRCNFRCAFCMPAGNEYTFLPRRELLTFEEIARVARVFAAFGVTKLRLTGGEPLLRREIEKLVALLARIPGTSDLALTTNGILLPDKARLLKEAGLRRVTVSLPSLDEATFTRLNGTGHSVAEVIAGIEAADAAGLTPLKINIVVIKGVNEEEIPRLAAWCKERRYVARFIEFMDVGTLNEWDLERVVPSQEILTRIDRELPLESLHRRRPSEVARRYRYRDDGLEVGTISSVTEPFCRDCTRARLSAEGHLYTCLFTRAGHDLKTALRAGASDADLEATIRGIWTRRSDRYSEERALSRGAAAGVGADERVEMFRIGG